MILSENRYPLFRIMLYVTSRIDAGARRKKVKEYRQSDGISDSGDVRNFGPRGLTKSATADWVAVHPSRLALGIGPAAANAAACSRPAKTCRRHAQPGGLRGSPRRPATGRGACRRR